MKNAILFSFFALFSCTTFAQNTWNGGTPGHEADWMEARNWSQQRVPGWNDNVVIPHLWHNNYPEIRTAVPAIAHLEVEGGARFEATADDAAVTGSIRAMVAAHAATMDGVEGWTMLAEEIPGGAALTVTGADTNRIRALGFIGVMTVGMHHQTHHLALATGQNPHAH